MLVNDTDLARLHGQTTMVGGGFDPLHEGHVAYFQAAAAFGLPVICSVDPDTYVARKHPVLLERPRRLLLIDALRPITYVYASPGATADALRAIRPRIFVKGADWRGRLPAPEVAACEALAIEVRYVEADLNSSSRLVERLISQARG